MITGRNMHEALPPASTAKIMTALVAVERLPPNAMVRVSPNAANRESMKIGMAPGARWPFQQVMASMMMVSANDAAYALAERVGGSISGFAADLNATAKRYGMRDSTFGDPAGLTDGTSYEGGPKVSAFDLAIAARNALTVPAIARWADTRTYDFTDPSGVHHELTAHNKFLPGNGFGYAGANGFKTGYTQAADHTLVATAKRNGRQCIAVILGGTDSGYTWAASLLDECWKKPPVATTGVRLPAVAVSPYETRVAARATFANIAVGSTGAALAATTPSPSTTAKPTTSTLARRPARGPPGAPEPHRPRPGRPRQRSPARVDPRRSRLAARPARPPAADPAARCAPAPRRARRLRGAPAPRGETAAGPAPRPPTRPGESHAQREPARGRRPLPDRHPGRPAARVAHAGTAQLHRSHRTRPESQIDGGQPPTSSA